MKATIILLIALATSAHADTIRLLPSKGEFVPSPACSNEALRARVWRFLGTHPEITLRGGRMWMLFDGETYDAREVVRDGKRWIGFWRGLGDAYRVVVSVDPSKPEPVVYFGIIEDKPHRCGEKWLGVGERI